MDRCRCCSFAVSCLALFLAGCASPKPPLWAVECGVGGYSDRRQVATDRFEEAADTLWQSYLAASGGDPVAAADVIGVDERAGLMRFGVITEGGEVGACSLQRVARRPSFGDLLKAILAARIEQQIGIPAQAIAPGVFSDVPSYGQPARGPAPDNTGRVRENTYGLGIHADEFGRPGQWVTEQGDVGQSPVREDVYGPGLGQDRYGRPVRFRTLHD